LNFSDEHAMEQLNLSARAHAQILQGGADFGGPIR
jgi:hypothetical protein